MGAVKIFDGEKWSLENRSSLTLLPKWREPLPKEYIDGIRIYTSKLGLKFGISSAPRPGKEGAVFFTAREYDWIKAQNLTPEEFQILHKFKADDFRYNPIPDPAMEQPKQLAMRYGGEIISKLRGTP